MDNQVPYMSYILWLWWFIFSIEQDEEGDEEDLFSIDMKCIRVNVYLKTSDLV